MLASKKCSAFYHHTSKRKKSLKFKNQNGVQDICKKCLVQIHGRLKKDVILVLYMEHLANKHQPLQAMNNADWSRNGGLPPRRADVGRGGQCSPEGALRET